MELGLNLDGLFSKPGGLTPEPALEYVSFKFHSAQHTTDDAMRKMRGHVMD